MIITKLDINICTRDAVILPLYTESRREKYVYTYSFFLEQQCLIQEQVVLLFPGEVFF